jgi:hypothetical protein
LCAGVRYEVSIVDIGALLSVLEGIRLRFAHARTVPRTIPLVPLRAVGKAGYGLVLLFEILTVTASGQAGGGCAFALDER